MLHNFGGTTHHVLYKPTLTPAFKAVLEGVECAVKTKAIRQYDVVYLQQLNHSKEIILQEVDARLLNEIAQAGFDYIEL